MNTASFNSGMFKAALSRYLSLAIYLLTLALGLLAFAAPFWAVAHPQSLASGLQPQDSPLWLSLLTGLCVAALVIEIQGQALSAKTVALLGLLVATNSALRFLEVSFPGPGGFTLLFAPVILSGFIFGARFGFLMGAFSLMASALVTAGVGPWLPYQMLTAGWIGMSAGWLGQGFKPYSAVRRKRRLLVGLMVFGFVWGMLYGAIMNLWFWAFFVGSPDQQWQPGMPALSALKAYATFYVATSAWWDFFGGLGNALIIAAVGLPTLQVLERFRQRLGEPTAQADIQTRIPANAQPTGRPVGLLEAQSAPNHPAPAAQPDNTARLQRAPSVTPPLSETPAARSVQPQAAEDLHPIAWLAWLCAALLVVSTARNPFYLIELLVIGAVISRSAGSKPGLSLGWRFGAFLIAFSVAFNGLSSHFGKTVLLRLPGGLPLIGGPITLESLVYGAVTGLSLTALLGLFVVFNQVIPAHQVVRLTPRAFHEAGVTLSIAVTYLPATRRSLDQIREAQAVRGHQLRSWRDWLPLWLPLLTSGLERAFQLAEAMTARGFGATADRAASTWARLSWVIGLVSLLAGQVLAAFRQAGPLATALTVGGGLWLAGCLALAGRNMPYTPYRSQRWGWPESLIVAGALLAVAVSVWPGLGVVCASGLGVCSSSTFYSPYPKALWPAFDPLLGLGLLGLLLPIALKKRP